jgi:hypothetical protein
MGAYSGLFLRSTVLTALGGSSPRYRERAAILGEFCGTVNVILFRRPSGAAYHGTANGEGVQKEPAVPHTTVPQNGEGCADGAQNHGTAKGGGCAEGAQRYRKLMERRVLYTI